MRRSLAWMILLGLGASACARVLTPQAGPTGTTPTPGPTPTHAPGPLPAGAPTEVVIARADFVLVLSSETGEVLRRLTRSPVWGDYAVEVPDDRSHVYVGRELTNFAETPSRSAIVRVPYGGGDPETLVEFDGLFGGVALSPDERFLAYSVGNGPDEGDFILHLATGELEEIDQFSYFSAGSFSPDSRFLAGNAGEDGRSGIGILDMSVSPPSRYAFFPNPDPRNRWGGPIYRGSEELIVFELECPPRENLCEGSPEADIVLDAQTGARKGSLDGPGLEPHVIDFDSSGEHALLGLRPEMYAGDYNPNSLWRLDDEGRLVQITPSYFDADW